MRLLTSALSRAVAFLGLSIAAMLLATSPAAAQDHDMAMHKAPPSPLSAKCASLLRENFAAIPDAPLRLLSAKLIEANDEKPIHCEVEGYVAPQVGILMWLPAENWNGKFLEVGCGGFCGSYAFMRNCVSPLAKGYACITTDMGHRGSQGGGLEWAHNNQQAVIDFAYRATHVTALAGKAVVQRFYGQKPSRSYFHGCSAGGRQGLIEAQRFPWDFDAVAAGAPAISYGDISLALVLRQQILKDAAGKPVFGPGQRFLIDAVRNKCDMNDGVKDGQIGDPRLCRFNAADYLCKAGPADGCLTKQQVDAFNAFYREQKTASGAHIGEYAYPLGIEESLFGGGGHNLLRSFYEDFFKYMGLDLPPGPDWKFESFDMNADYRRMGMIEGLMDATNPDFTRFKQAGGKLILYHGWGDGGLAPYTTINQYEKIERTMGGRAPTQEFLRLFMVPDMDHCGGGPGPNSIDFVDYLDQWVEKGKAPDMLIGAHYTDAHNPPAKALTGKPKFTRPIYPYPLSTVYKGKGDPNDAANFRAVRSEK